MWRAHWNTEMFSQGPPSCPGDNVHHDLHAPVTHIDRKAEERWLPPKETKEQEKYSEADIETKVKEIT